jgi:hypothetical protein
MDIQIKVKQILTVIKCQRNEGVELLDDEK